MAWVELILVKFLVPISWPLAVFFGLLLFHKDLRDLVRRAVKFGPSGFEAVPPSQSAERVKDAVGTGIITSTSDLSESSPEPLLASAPLLEPWEPPILEDVNRWKARGVPSDAILELAVRDLAFARQRIAFETITRQVFGTQLALLAHLQDGEPHSREELSPLFYEHLHQVLAIPNLPANFISPSFEMWIQFLLDLTLVRFVRGKYQVTDQGRAYLEFAQNAGLMGTRAL